MQLHLYSLKSNHSSSNLWVGCVLAYTKKSKKLLTGIYNKLARGWLREINYRVDHKRFMEAPGLILYICETNYNFLLQFFCHCYFLASTVVAAPASRSVLEPQCHDAVTEWLSSVYGQSVPVANQRMTVHSGRKKNGEGRPRCFGCIIRLFSRNLPLH